MQIIFPIMMLLNLVAAPVAVIWLGIESCWPLIGWGLIYIVAMPLLWGIVILPLSTAIDAACRFLERGRAGISLLIVFLVALYQNVAIGAWVLAVVYLLFQWSGFASHVPLLLAGYCIVFSPLWYMQERHCAFLDEIGWTSTTGILMGVISYTTFATIYLLGFSVELVIASFLVLAVALSVWSVVLIHCVTEGVRPVNPKVVEHHHYYC